MNSAVHFDDNATCTRCGRFGAYVFESEKLCSDCYETRGACCPEFGGDDLTAPVNAAAPNQKVGGAKPAVSPEDSIQNEL
jgi:hypothetical protein